MRKYTSQATKWLAAASLICALACLTGIILILTGIQNICVPVAMIGLGAFLGFLCFVCFLAEKSRALTIDTEKAVFPGGADVNGKTVYQKTTVILSEIRSVESRLDNGDGLISKDTYYHTLKLKNGTNITVTLYAYGKEAEKEIIQILSTAS